MRFWIIIILVIDSEKSIAACRTAWKQIYEVTRMTFALIVSMMKQKWSTFDKSILIPSLKFDPFQNIFIKIHQMYNNKKCNPYKNIY